MLMWKTNDEWGKKNHVPCACSGNEKIRRSIIKNINLRQHAAGTKSVEKVKAIMFWSDMTTNTGDWQNLCVCGGGGAARI